MRFTLVAGDRGGEPVERAVGHDARAGGRRRRESPDRVDHTRIHCAPGREYRLHVRLVGGNEELERRARADLAREIARGAVREPHLLPGGRCECAGDLVHRELQVRGDGDVRRFDRRALGRFGAGREPHRDKCERGGKHQR